MTITLDHIVPTPLRGKLAARPSTVWNKHVLLTPGQWVKVTAPSGTGKTTLMHLLWQLRTDYQGQLLYDGTNAGAFKPPALAQLRQTQLSVVFQDLRLFGQLTARENIELKRVMHTPAYCTPADVDRMAEALGIAHILQQKASICSYGERQRIAIVRALMQPFNWLLMDEPFSHLDQANIARAASLIAQECQRRGAGMLLADLEDDTHFAYHQHLQL
ncbi:MAG: ATP-binding cassette domain-containing protein [Bacteroidetes bacterium]|nr:MAG: ATP-binding cassette domain-containing protein [Bacteroidota bacterium]